MTEPTYFSSLTLFRRAYRVSPPLPTAQRWLGVVPRSKNKSLGIHLLELVICYFLVGALGLALEHADGQIYPQGWEFYATTAALFLTLAFPGFVYRYLYKRHG